MLIGFAIILVVFGHLLIPQFEHLETYVKLRETIYKFHMPLFMFLSGFIIAISTRKIQFSSYFNFLKTKLLKFIPAYVLFASIFVLFEYLAMDQTLEELAHNHISNLLLSP